MIDSHAHLSGSELYPKIDPIMAKGREAGLKAVVNICTEEESLKHGLELVERYPWVFNTAAVTPHEAHQDMEEFFSKLSQLARNSKLVAIGETGLEYHYCLDTAPAQKKWMIRHFQLALECQLPVVIHCREAFKDLFEIVDVEYRVKGQIAPGVLHCFTGTLDDAKEVVKRGWYVSFSGIVTYKKSTELQETAKWVPLENMLIETDAPWLAPQSHRGKQNEPALVKEVASMIANLKGIGIEEVLKITEQNAIKVFNLPIR